jgi:hypothetical protein
MPLEVQTLSELDQDDIDQAFEFAVTLLTEKQPNIDARRGVLGALVVGLDAILGAAARENTSLLRLSSTLQGINETPTLADDDIVNQTISNYRLSRRAATEATGEVTIVLNQLIATTIAAGAVFEAEGNQFQTESAYSARTSSANVLTSTDRLISQIADDRWAFTIPLVAVTAGSESLITKDTQMVPLAAPTSFVTAYAASDFNNGLNQQTNADLVALIEGGIAARAYSNRVTVPATIRNASEDDYDSVTDEFPNILGMSIVGYGDSEMARDQHWLFPVSGGGRSDVYLRTQRLPQATALTKTATLIDNVEDGGIWQFSIGRAEVPGFYEVSKVLLEGADTGTSGYEITEDIRGTDLTGDVYVPDILTTTEAVYSRYQAATIRFLDTDTVVIESQVGSRTQDYDVTVTGMPLVENIQEFLGERGIVNPAGDILVKAGIPCFLQLSFTIQRQRSDATINETTIKSALAEYVNTTLFPGRLYAGALCRLVDEQLPVNVDVSAIDMFGRIRRPDGVNQYIRSEEVLIVPEVASAFTSGRTVVFLLDVADIALSVIDVDVPAV